MSNFKYAKTLIPALIAVDCASDGTAKENLKQPNKPLVCRPSELPLYPDSQELNKQEIRRKVTDDNGPFEQLIGSVRSATHEITSVVDSPALDHYKNEVKSYVSYLQVEENIAPRVGAIATAGLAGFIFGMRRGFFRKLIYSSVAAFGMTSVCYPNETAEFSKSFLHDSRKVITIGYNFIFGIKPSEDSDNDFIFHVPSFSNVQQRFGEYSDQMKKKLGISPKDDFDSSYESYPITRHSPPSENPSKPKEKEIQKNVLRDFMEVNSPKE